MKNRLVRSMLMVGAMVMALATPVYAMEEKDVVYSEKTAQTRSVSTATTKTVEDFVGNKYNVVMYSDKYSDKSGKKFAIAETTFNVSHYSGGDTESKELVDGYEKTLTLSSDITMSNHGTVAKSTMEHSNVFTGKKGTLYKQKEVIYSITSVKTTHTFHCHGKRAEFTTYL